MKRRVYINPNYNGLKKTKWECHKLMEEVFGKDKVGKRNAYAWMKKKWGKEIHFATIYSHDLLREIHEELWKLSFKKSMIQ